MEFPKGTIERYRSAWQLFTSGASKDAWRLSSGLNQSAPEFPAGWDLSSRIALSMGKPEAALALAERALAIDSTSTAFLSHKAFCLLSLHRIEEAREITGLLSQKPPVTAAEFDTLGNLFSQLKDQKAAEACFEKAVALEPNRSHYNTNLALARQANGDLCGAEQAFDKSIRQDPDDYEAWLHRSRLRKQSPESNHVDELTKQIAAGGRSWRAEMSLHYALAKEYEDLGEYSKSFFQLNKGAGLRRAHMQHNPQADIDAMQCIAQHFSKQYLQTKVQGHHSQEPVFIVGLPRTGTTLVERILGSHSCVFAAGELNDFAENLTRLVLANEGRKPANRQQFIEASTRIDFADLGKSYVESTRPYTGEKPRFIDKLPLNFLYCGLILRALPNARIIHLTRNPMDTCFAVYKTLFKQAYPFSYDLDELGGYYLSYRELMLHWHEAMPGRILDVSYEELTSGLEGECRKILAYCDLPWEDACLDFHRNAAPSMTASLAQVRQPVYTSSIGRWRNYRNELQPLDKRFREAGLDF